MNLLLLTEAVEGDVVEEAKTFGDKLLDFSSKWYPVFIVMAIIAVALICLFNYLRGKKGKLFSFSLPAAVLTMATLTEATTTEATKTFAEWCADKMPVFVVIAAIAGLGYLAVTLIKKYFGNDKRR